MATSSLAIVNARAWTGDPRRPWADALLVSGERIVLVGSSAEVKKRAGAVVPTIDAAGMMVAPGFVDAHADLDVRDLPGAMRRLAARGVTSVHHMGGWDDVAMLRDAHERGELTARVTAAVPLDTWQRLRDEIARLGRGDAWLRLGGLTAPAHAALHQTAAAADAAGLQLLLATEDEDALSVQLDFVARILAERGARDRRARIESTSPAAPADLARLAALGVVLCVLNAGAATDAGHARIRDAGARLAFGSGGPAPRATPLETICATVAPAHPATAPADAILRAPPFRVDDALRASTSGPAWAGFQESEVGMLRPGMLADLIVIDRDVTRAPPGTIRDARVVLTLAGGLAVFDAPGLVPPG